MEPRQDTRLVRLKAQDKRRGHVLRRYTFQGITFNAGAGWSRVGRQIADYVREVRQVDGDEHAPLAFDVCTDAEARLIDESDARDAQTVRRATDDLPTQAGRGTTTTADLPGEASAAPTQTTEAIPRRPADRKGKE